MVINSLVVRMRRKSVMMIADACIVAASFYVSLFIRFEFDYAMIRHELSRMLPYLPAMTAIYIGIFYSCGMYKILWRYAGNRQLAAQGLCAMAAGALIYLIRVLSDLSLSRSVLIISCVLITSCVACFRLLTRSLRAWHVARKDEAESSAGRNVPLLIVGAGSAASYAISLCLRHTSIGHPVAAVDDAPEKQGMRIQGVEVVGTVRDIPSVVEKYKIRLIIIAIPSQKGARLNEIISICNSTHCSVRTLSDPQKVTDDYHSGILALHEPNVADFLSRDEIRLDTAGIHDYISDKTVMVTGGGGSIGSEICRQLMPFKPKRLVVFDMYENCAYELEMELKGKYGANAPISILIGSIRDRRRLTEVMNTVRPDVVFHAAAHKHVPLMEYSPAEAVKNNIFGTMNVIEAADAVGAERFVMLSTDKAVNPTNIMGATKRVCEMITQYYSRNKRIKCVAVRFGNVLGSHGSVIPLFEKQIKAGGPITLTHERITRYFMTIPEAAQLVLQAGSMAESGSVYVLDMGEPVLIRDLAVKLIRFYGLEPDQDIEIKITGLRRGEKLYEELLMDAEAHLMKKTGHDKIMVAPCIKMDDVFFSGQIAKLRSLVYESDTPIDQKAIEQILHQLVPNFNHLLNGDAPPESE